jgi:hypothetical protein
MLSALHMTSSHVCRHGFARPTAQQQQGNHEQE